MSLHVVILAAGKGSRMKSKLPKVLHEVAGTPMLGHVIETARTLNPDVIHVVIGHGANAVRQRFLDEQINWVEQSEQLGTGHAVAQALPDIPDDVPVLILYGDVPLIRASTLQALCDLVDQNTLALLTAYMDDPTGYGRIVRDVADDVKAIVEQKDASADQLSIQEVNTGIMSVNSSLLKAWLPKLSSDNAQAEYYLTDTIEMAVSDQKEVETHQPDSLEEVQGVNDRVQLCELECFVQSQIAEDLMRAGVKLYDPNRLDVRGKLETGVDVVIDVNTLFEGHVVIEDDVMIGPNCSIKNAHIHKGAVIKANSVIEDAEIGPNADVGPFARIRPGTVLGPNTKVGNFVETKKALVGEGSKINHLSYVGDAELGHNVNVGAGTITCNYDGVNKSKTTLGDDVFIGSNTSLVAPVELGAGSTTGAGSVITANVSEGNLAVGRAKQRNISGWKRPEKKDKS